MTTPWYELAVEYIQIPLESGKPLGCAVWWMNGERTVTIHWHTLPNQSKSKKSLEKRNVKEETWQLLISKAWTVSLDSELLEGKDGVHFVQMSECCAK